MKEYLAITWLGLTYSSPLFALVVVVVLLRRGRKNREAEADSPQLATVLGVILLFALVAGPLWIIFKMLQNGVVVR